MTIRIEAFLSLEKSLGSRLSASWARVASEVGVAVEKALQAGDYALAYKLAHGLDAAQVYEENREYIHFFSYAALFFGASRLTKDVKQTVIARGGFSGVINKASQNLMRQITHNVVEQARDRLLQEIQKREAQGREQVLKYDPNQPREPAGTSTGGQFASRSGSKKVTQTAAFKKWFGKSKVVDENGEPLVLYHGTQGDFAEFSREMANTESDLGAGFYFTNQAGDLERNYAGHHGPDFKNKLEREKEQIASEDEELSEEEVHLVALARLHAVHGGASMPVFLKMENPFHIGENDTVLDYEESYDEETDEYGEPQGKLIEFIGHLREAASRYDDGDVEPLIESIMERARDYGGIRGSELFSLIQQDEHFDYYRDYDDNGKMVSREIFREAIERAGFDGFIDTTVEEKFNMGLARETTHYVVFHPTQIKSAIGNTTFGPDKADITKALKVGERLAQPFESFDTEGRTMLQLISALHTSRLSAYGYTAEADVLGVQKYAITEQLDNRICPVCEVMHGREFDVQVARTALDQILDTNDPEDLRQLQPWPKQTKAAVAELKEMSQSEIIERNWMIPPYHPWCRGLLVSIDDVPSIADTPSFQQAFGPEEPPSPEETSVQTFSEYGLDVSQEQAARWDRHIGVNVGEVLAGLTNTDPLSLIQANTLKNSLLEIQRSRVRFDFEIPNVSMMMAFHVAERDLSIDKVRFPAGQAGATVALMSSWSNTWERMGVETVSLEANIDVGAFAWAKYGWVPTTEDWQGMKGNLLQKANLVLDRVSTPTREVIVKALASNNPKAIWLLTDLVEEIDGMPVGHLLLAGERWEAYLDRNDPEAMARFQLYVEKMA